MKMNSKKITAIIALFLFSLIHAQTVDAVIYNCTDYYLGAGLCQDHGSLPEISIAVYKCNEAGGYTTSTYIANCTYLLDGTRSCEQNPDPVKGYSTPDAASTGCKCTNGTCKTRYACLPTGRCANDPRWECSDSNDCACMEYNLKCPGPEDGNKIGVAACCGIDEEGGGGGCTPTCPNPPCTLSDASCASANGGNSNYKLTQPSGAFCTGTNATCTNPDGCGGQKICNTAACYASNECTPATPSGYQDTSPGPLCNTPKIPKPSCTTNCGNTKEKNVYPVETNTETPPTPEDLKIKVDNWISPNLSTSVGTPTLIKYPFPTSTTETSIKNITTTPTGAREFGWELHWGTTMTDTEMIVPRKIFTGTNPNIYTSKPTFSQSNQGMQRIFKARTYTKNRCDEGEKYSEYLQGNYKVNTLPEVTEVIMPGEYTSPTNGCKTTAHTGIEANNPLTIKVTGTDVDNFEDINGVIIWLVKEGSGRDINTVRNQQTYVGSSATQTDPNMIGLLLPATGGLYKSNNPTGTLIDWGNDANPTTNIGTLKVQDRNGKTLIHEAKLAGTPIKNDTKQEITFTVTLDFQATVANFGFQNGTYKIYAGLTDTLSYVQESNGATSLDQRSINIGTSPTWTFDFINPTIPRLNAASIDNQRITSISWDSHDEGSGIPKDYTVVNIYKEEDQHEITRIEPKPEVSKDIVNTPSNIEEIGALELDENSTWIHPTAGGDDQRMSIDIGDNQSGTLLYYVTAYDVACNRSGPKYQPSPNLDKWISTKGGIFYSKGKIDYETKELGEYNLATELITTNSALFPVRKINTIRFSPQAPNPNPAAAQNTKDINEVYSPQPYLALLRNLELKKKDLGKAEILGQGINTLIRCTNPNGCYYQTNRIERDTKYRGKIIIEAEDGKDMLIDADITAEDSDRDVLFILSKKNIIIKGKTATGEGDKEAHTDHVDAFLIAKENIIIETGNGPDNKYQDRIEMAGSIVAFGIETEDNRKPAFLLRRTIGLFNAQSPVLTVNYHPKYSQASQFFFGVQNTAYKREVGFKPM